MATQELNTQRRLSSGKGYGSSSGWGNYGGASWSSGKGGKDRHHYHEDKGTGKDGKHKKAKGGRPN